MHRIVNTTPLDDDTVRTRVRIESDPCEKGSVFARQLASMLFQNLADDPSLTLCGYEPFQTFKMHHNGERWIIELESIVRRQHGQESRSPTQAAPGRNQG